MSSSGSVPSPAASAVTLVVADAVQSSGDN